MVHAGGTGTGASGGDSDSHDIDDDSINSNLLQLGLGSVFILVQVLCSVIAGVYNEYIIKGAGADIHIMIQNVFMYLDSILCNVALLTAKVRNTVKTTSN